jgi:hypothetical protein
MRRPGLADQQTSDPSERPGGRSRASESVSRARGPQCSGAFGHDRQRR